MSIKARPLEGISNGGISAYGHNATEWLRDYIMHKDGPLCLAIVITKMFGL